MRHLGVILLCTLLVSCATDRMVDEGDSLSVFTYAKLNVDQYSGQRDIRGPVVKRSRLLRDDLYQGVAVSKSSASDDWAFVLLFNVDGRRYHYLSKAFANGREYEAKLFDRRRYACVPKQGCSYEEKINVALTKADWRQAARDGLALKLWGKRGELTFNIPAAYFDGILRRVEHVGAEEGV